MTKRKVHAYLDADIIQYRAASFCADEWEGEPAADVGQAMWFFDLFVNKWLTEASKEVEITGYSLVFTQWCQFRKDMYPEYKANRKELKIWPGMRRFKTELLELLQAEYEPGLEADDYIGIKVTESPADRIAISADKDFQTLPITFYVPSSHGKTKGEWFNVDEGQANLNWLKQAMCGDTIDNYKGIFRFGETRANTLLPSPQPVEAMWPKVEGMFLSKGYTKEYALTMARLARILRAGEYNFDTKEVKLWEPLT